MSFPFGQFVVDENADPNTVYLVGLCMKPIVLAPCQSITDISFKEQIERGIDWEATGRASAMITNIGEENNEPSNQ
jgi:hypothetical protein